MTINRILYVDDSFENGLTAMGVDPRIDYVASVGLIARPLQEYDCIITDMRMEHAESGMELVERAIREGRLPWVATGGTYEHGGTYNRVKVFNSDLVKIFDKMSKSEDRFWNGAIRFIEANEGTPIHQALRKVRETLGVIPEDQVKILMNFYRENHTKNSDFNNKRRI